MLTQYAKGGPETLKKRAYLSEGVKTRLRMSKTLLDHWRDLHKGCEDGQLGTDVENACKRFRGGEYDDVAFIEKTLALVSPGEEFLLVSAPKGMQPACIRLAIACAVMKEGGVQ